MLRRQFRAVDSLQWTRPLNWPTLSQRGRTVPSSPVIPRLHEEAYMKQTWSEHIENQSKKTSTVYKAMYGRYESKLENSKNGSGAILSRVKFQTVGCAIWSL